MDWHVGRTRSGLPCGSRLVTWSHFATWRLSNLSGDLYLGTWNYPIPLSPSLPHDIQLTFSILPERRYLATRRDERREVQDGHVGPFDAVDLGVAVIGVEVIALDHRHRAAAVHVAAHDRARVERMDVLDDRRDPDCRARIGRVAVRPFHDIPAVVRAGAALHRRGRGIDFLPHLLSPVADVEVAVLPAERETPRIAEPVRPHLGRETGVGRGGIVGRHGVAARAADVEPEQLAEQRVLVLAVVPGVAGAAAVP